MADIALVFGWQPSEFQQMTLEELMQWHEKAVNRYQYLQPRWE
ncbi:GpE family phage tail protein [Gallibacterium anatis]|uniref:GpE family phage tail protein n=1 Tax=Gallibacterium anatis TaxID=750 RepID=A0A0A2ZA05_9PAST|nr:GpE family phage tail protein [Gallibacterium anatis]KGQ24264.1 phage P2 protein GpE [Gallibacterium anatis]KGQ32523.1 phage P2 protein GpE [Gallibacterium anatis]KGQ40073.1 phage P2 protein GpE [Gallibacterium anatis IPDH697-78]KGQ46374.1 phage P2 protein GpE [Gallibacterium anatis]KGQ49250.1 phage P2 protein GpE [Gallibacterium anatis 10672-6]